MKHLLRSSLLFLLCLSFFVCPSFAADSQRVERICYEDGSYATIERSYKEMSRATVADSKTYTYYSPLGEKCFSYTLYASFSYNGMTSSAETSSDSVGLYMKDWKCSSSNNYTSGKTAYGNAVFSSSNGKTRSVALSLTCDKNGNVS